MFDGDKIIRDAREAHVGQLGWLGTTVESLREAVETEPPRKLVQVIVGRTMLGAPFSFFDRDSVVGFYPLFYPLDAGGVRAHVMWLFSEELGAVWCNGEITVGEYGEVVLTLSDKGVVVSTGMGTEVSFELPYEEIRDVDAFDGRLCITMKERNAVKEYRFAWR